MPFNLSKMFANLFGLYGVVPSRPKYFHDKGSNKNSTVNFIKLLFFLHAVRSANVVIVITSFVWKRKFGSSTTVI